jgi:2-methylcitrate dehydratase PrpD
VFAADRVDYRAAGGKVSLTTGNSSMLHGRVDEPKGDPGNTLGRKEIDAKARRLARYGKAIEEGKIERPMRRLWPIAEQTSVEPLV